MKTTVEIADGLLAEARQLAATSGTTLRAILEAALRAELDRRRHPPRFQLRDVSFGDPGVVVELDAASWRHALDLSYEGRGG